LSAYAARTFADRPRNLHAAALAIGFLARIDAEGWEVRHDADLGISLALPELLMGEPEPEEGGTRRWGAGGALTVLTHGFSGKGAANWHAAAETTNADPAALVIRREDGLFVTRGRLSDGRTFLTRSDRVGEVWATVYVAGADAALGLLDLIAASIEPGVAPPWDLPADGRVAAFLDATVELLYAVAGDLPVRAPAAEMPSAAEGTGTGFFVADRVLLTASHVVGGCTRVALADGTELRRLGADTNLDVAAFASAAPSPDWFTLSAAPQARLGQRVHAAGFPYYSIVGTTLHLTGGNVSALAGVNDDARFFSFTAPVQPGNSGGPLIDAEGRVMGLVVSRLSEHYIVEETGSLPQNMNYALGSAALAAFLERIGASHRDGGLGSFDMDAGMPEGFERAVVPVICLSQTDPN
jgi:S1-C subfamily serine protease